MRGQSVRPVQRRAACASVATLLTVVWLTTAPASAQQPARAPLTEVERAIHLLGRTTYGVRPQDVTEILDLGAERWLDRQLHPESIWERPYVASLAGSALPQSGGRPAPDVAGMMTVGTSPAIVGDFPVIDGNIRLTPEQTSAELRRRAAVQVESGNDAVAVAPVARKLDRAIGSPKQLEEVMTDFWFNHFNVSYNKADVRVALVDYEDTAIRPYVFKRFEDLLIETARHPANYQSKVKRPFEYVASVLRVTGGALDVQDRDLRQQRVGLVGALQTLHNVPYHESAPTGFPTTSDEWVSAGAMIYRMNLALDLANGRVQGVGLDPWSILETATAAEVRSVVPQPAALPPELRAAVSEDVTRQVLFGRSPDALRAVIQEDLARSEGLSANALVARALGLALGSPRSRGTEDPMRAPLPVALLLAIQVHGALGQSPAPRLTLSERERAVHLLNRATYGARPEDVEEVLRIGRNAWIDRQLRPETLEPRLIEAGPVTSEVPIGRESARPGTTATRLVVQNGGGTLVNRPLANKLVRAAQSQRQLEQVMTDFWFNHFSVSEDSLTESSVASYEDSIRAHVFGRFRDLLGATAHHPAMLIYLDNYLSGSPPPGSTTATAHSLDDSYARALLELHTLGAGGGYTREDVTAVARAFTGWSTSLTSLRQPVGAPTYRPQWGELHFVYRLDWHERTEKVVLGRKLVAPRDGDEVLDRLARHPATARHVATKLVRQFVADDPPAALIEELTRVFLRSDGDLASVTRALFTSERFYDPLHYRAKVRRPFEFVAAALRLTHATLGPGAAVMLQGPLSAMQHSPYRAPTPSGYPTSAEHWVSAQAMVDRVNLAVQISNNAVGQRSGGIPGRPDIRDGPGPVPAVAVDPWAVAVLDRGAFVRPGDLEFGRKASAGILSRLVQGAPAGRLETDVPRELLGLQAPDAADAALRRAIALVLGSPEFQRY